MALTIAHIRIVVEALTQKATQQMTKFQKTVDGTKGSSEGLKKAFKASAKSFAVFSAGAYAASKVLKQMWSAAEDGAKAVDTASAFARLNQEVVPTIDLLQKLRDASHNSIDDSALMSSMLLLVTGSTGQLRDAMVEAAPSLMEIATAASKMNPTLGDSTFLFESLTKGIKRGSPLILDNLGILVSVAEANKIYASSIGKTVQELTAEEKQMALLNEALKEGQVLIQQAGGTQPGMVTPYQQVAASWKNIISSNQVDLANFFEPAVNFLAQASLAYSTRIDDLKWAESHIGELLTQQDYNKLYFTPAEELHETVTALKEEFSQIGVVSRTTGKQWVHNLGGMIDGNEELVLSAEEVALAEKQAAEEAKVYKENVDLLLKSLYSSGSAADAFSAAMKGIEYNSKVNVRELALFREQFEGLFVGGAIDQGQLYWAHQRMGIEAVVQEFEGGLIPHWEAVGRLSKEFGLTGNQAWSYLAGTSDAASEIAGWLSIINGLGLGGLDTEELSTHLMENAELLEYIQRLIGEIDGSTANARVNIHTVNTAATGYSYWQEQSGGGLPPIGQANGGSFTVPSTYTNEAFMLGNGLRASGGEQVQVTPAGAQNEDIINAIEGLPVKLADELILKIGLGENV